MARKGFVPWNKNTGKWSMKYDCCIRCHTVKRRYEGKGLCSKCYYDDYREENRDLCREWARNHYNSHKDDKEFREKARKVSKASYWKKPEHYRNNTKVWREKNPAEAAMQKIIYPTARPKRPLEYWQNRYFLLFVLNKGCKVCNSFIKRQIHHIIPEAQGGNHKLDNLEVYCEDHHLRNGLHNGGG